MNKRINSTDLARRVPIEGEDVGQARTIEQRVAQLEKQMGELFTGGKGDVFTLTQVVGRMGSYIEELRARTPHMQGTVALVAKLQADVERLKIVVEGMQSRERNRLIT